MKTLILYGTRHGCTRLAAHQLAQHLPNVDVVDVARPGNLDLGAYENVIIGSSIYVGQINKELSQFLLSNLAALQQKRIGLFVCCGYEEKAMEQLAAGFPPELVQAASAKGYFGYDFTQLSFPEKLICKAIGAPIGKREIKSSAIESFARSFAPAA